MTAVGGGKRGQMASKDDKKEYPYIGSSFLSTDGAVVWDTQSGVNLSLPAETLIKITSNCKEGTIGEIKTGVYRGREVMMLLENLKHFLPL